MCNLRGIATRVSLVEARGHFEKRYKDLREKGQKIGFTIIQAVYNTIKEKNAVKEKPTAKTSELKKHPLDPSQQSKDSVPPSRKRAKVVGGSLKEEEMEEVLHSTSLAKEKPKLSRAREVTRNVSLDTKLVKEAEKKKPVAATADLSTASNATVQTTGISDEQATAKGNNPEKTIPSEMPNSSQLDADLPRTRLAKTHETNVSNTEEIPKIEKTFFSTELADTTVSMTATYNQVAPNE